MKLVAGKYIIAEEPLDIAKQNGVRFEGENGWSEVTRREYHASDPELMFVREKSNGEYEEAPGHYQTFIDSMRSRQEDGGIKDAACQVFRFNRETYV